MAKDLITGKEIRTKEFCARIDGGGIRKRLVIKPWKENPSCFKFEGIDRNLSAIRHLKDFLINRNYCRKDLDSGKIIFDSEVESIFNRNFLPVKPFGSRFYRVKENRYVASSNIVFEYLGFSPDSNVLVSQFGCPLYLEMERIENALKEVNLLREDVSENARVFFESDLERYLSLKNQIASLFNAKE